MSEITLTSEPKITGLYIEKKIPETVWIIHPFGEPRDSKEITMSIQVWKELNFFYRWMLTLLFGFKFYRPKKKSKFMICNNCVITEKLTTKYPTGGNTISLTECDWCGDKDVMCTPIIDFKEGGSGTWD